MEAASVSRQQIIDALREHLEERSDVLAAWLGGSDATGRTDGYSDIDLQLIVRDGTVEEILGAVHQTLETLSPIRIAHRLPEPTWHGHAQEFLQLRDASPHHFIDLLIIQESAPDRFLERERHGTPLILFDRGDYLIPPPLDWSAHHARMVSRFRALRARVSLFQVLVTRAIRRRRGAEAVVTYHSMTLGPLVELLRLRYCPQRFDYGIRYIDRDLPPEWREEIEGLAYPSSPTMLAEFHARAAEHIASQLAAFDRGEWELSRGNG